jgi:hypothetical protein
MTALDTFCSLINMRVIKRDRRQVVAATGADAAFSITRNIPQETTLFLSTIKTSSNCGLTHSSRNFFIRLMSAVLRLNKVEFGVAS